MRKLQNYLLFSVKRFIFAPVNIYYLYMNKSFLSFLNGIFFLFLFLVSGIQSVWGQNFRDQQDLQWVAYPVTWQGKSGAPSIGWTYLLGEKASILVKLLYHGVPMTDVEISYNVAADCMPHDGEWEKVRVAHDGSAAIEFTSKKPGFLDVLMRCTVEGQEFQNHIKVGFRPDMLTPYTQDPADFDNYWQQVLKEQESVALKPVVTPAPEYSSDKVDCYLVKLNGGTRQVPHVMYGYVSIPKKEGKFPVLVSPPGAGVKPMNPLKTQFYASEGDIIRLDLEIHGINPALSADDYKDISRSFGDHNANGYLASGLQSRDTYYMKKVYPMLLRAVDYLTTLPQWDGKNILVQGNSQGAALSLVLAALDKRITAVAIAHPALSDMAGYAEKGRTGGYPHFGNKYKEVELTPEVIKTLSYYDVVNFARRVTCPVYMTWGYNDNTCPPTTSWIVWNTLKCEKEMYLTPINEHWISTETRYRQMRYLLSQCK